MTRALMLATLVLGAMAAAAHAVPAARPGAVPASIVEDIQARKCKAGWYYSKKAAKCRKKRSAKKAGPKAGSGAAPKPKGSH